MKLPKENNTISNKLQNNPSLENSSSKTKEKQAAANDTVVEIRFLAHSWLDNFEKQAFKGKTVKELLNEANYGKQTDY